MTTATKTTTFRVIQLAVLKQFEQMKQHKLYRIDLSGAEGEGLASEQRMAITGQRLWERYLASFPEGTNPIYRERTEHDCSCCRHFIKTMGGVVAIVDGKVVSIWDFCEDDGLGFYAEVGREMYALVAAAVIDNVFLHFEPAVGVEKTFQQVVSLDTESAALNTRKVPAPITTTETLAWEHFHLRLPGGVVRDKAAIGPARAEARATFDVLKRGLEELTLEAVDTVLELVAQNSLYRGEEHKRALTEFRRLKVQWTNLADSVAESHYEADAHAEFETSLAHQRDLFVWSNLGSFAARIRNTAIGTLLIDLSDAVELEDAVNKFERSIMAPSNYKRPTALVSKAMIAAAQVQIEALGLTSALERRHAHLEDITANNVLWTVRKTQRSKNIFEELTAATPENSKKFDRVEELNIERFLEDVLPRAQSVELMVENRHAGNFVSLIAPVDPGAGRLFKWPNNFSWSYAGEAADSIKERVKSKGGNVTGDLRCSLAWFNYDDLDLHMKEPGGGVEVYYGNKRSYATGGVLDVDMNPGGGHAANSRCSRSAVENIAYPSKARMLEGVYELYVHNFRKMEAVDVGFEVEVEFGGETLSFAYPKAVRGGESVSVASIEYTKRGGFKILKSLPATSASRQVWGLTTNTWVPVDVVTLSPNYWWDEFALKQATRGSKGQMSDLTVMERGGVGVGNKHYFFLLNGCKNEDKARGFYNEFLDARLEAHRKVFEMVGARMRAEEDGRQLSGLGFSSTQRNSVLARVKGSFERVVKVVF